MSLIQIDDENYMPKWMKEKLEREEKSMEEKEKNKERKEIESLTNKDVKEHLMANLKNETPKSDDSIEESDESEKARSKRAMVTGATHLNVRDEPGGNRIGSIQNGYVVKIVEETGNWAHVKWGDYLDKDGWCMRAYLKPVQQL